MAPDDGAVIGVSGRRVESARCQHYFLLKRHGIYWLINDMCM